MSTSTRRSPLPPGPRTPVLLQTWAYWGRRDRMLQRCRDRFGATFTVRALPAGTMVYVTDPEDVKTVFTGDPDVYRAGEANAVLRPVMGPQSVLVADQPAHLDRRKRMLPAFHGASVERYVEIVREATEASMRDWPLNRPFALLPRMQAVTLEVILRAVVGVTEELDAAPLRTTLRELATVSPTVMLMWLRPELRHIGPWRRYARVKERADELLYDVIRRRRAAADLDRRLDVLSVLMRGADGDAGMSDEELRDQLVTLLLAGHETTATGLAWAFERLLRSPRQLDRLRVELQDGDEEYLGAVVTETLRVRPVIFDVARVLHAPVRLGGYELPAGVTVVPSIGLVHSREDLYADAGEFRPERFLDRRPGTYEWLPFGGGIRRCLGAPFALVEMRTVLRTVLEGVELAAADAAPEGPRMHHITFVPERGCRVVAQSSARGSSSRHVPASTTT
jgi:cytochrome P450 family 135